ncbi:MAG: glycosyltransferase family 4 protein [Myxococcales bacterium]|nr:glycosyltransferase family 4 protein [Myxococcales bacterium]
MHVALLTDYFVPHAPGGAEWSALALAEGLAARGDRVSVVTLDLADAAARPAVERLDGELAGRGIRVERLPFGRKMSGEPQTFPSYVFGNPWTERRLSGRVAAAVAALRPDVLHVQGLGLLIPGHFAARAHNRPLLFTVRDYRPLCPVAICLHRQDAPPRGCDRRRFRACTREYLEIYGLALSAAARLRYRLRRELEWSARLRQARVFPELDAAVFVSAAARQHYLAAGMTARHLAVIHNPPVPESDFADPDELRRRFGLNGPVALFVGRWSLGKGAAEMSRAWDLVTSRLPAAQLVIVGRRESGETPLDGRVVFTGPLPHREVLGLMQAAAVHVLPSRWPEPFSRTALEAMAAARPIVATAVGGNPELVRDGETGWLVPRGDPAAFASRLADLLGDPERAEAMGAAGRARLGAELSAEKSLAEWQALYAAVAERRGKLLRVCAPATSLSEKTVQGGGYFHVKNLQALAARGVALRIPLAFRPEYEPRENWDVRPIPVRRAYKLGALLSNLVFGGAVVGQAAFRRRFDLLRIGDLYHMGPGLLLAARLCGLPTCGVLHHIDHERRLENAVVGWTARRLDCLTVPSRATAADVARTFGVDPLRIRVIAEGATIFAGAAADRAEARRRLNLPDGPLLGFVGGLEARKNVDFLLRAFALLAAQIPAARLLVVGDGSQRAALEDQARALGVGDRVVFAGRLFEEGKANAYRAMDLFVFPSRNEGFGLAVAEAMAMGVPPVVSDRGSLPEVVVDRVTGRVLSLDDPAAWVAACGELLRDESERARLGAAAREHAATNFTWEASAADAEAAFRAVLAEKKEINLGVLLNSGDSLAVMKREGQEDRFVRSYLGRYAASFDRVYVFSYGDDRLRPYPNAVFVPGRPRWKGPLYAALAPFLHAATFRRLALLRVMQTGAALPAVLARLLYGVPFVATYGYRYGDFMRVKGRRLYGWYLDRLERLTFRLAARVIVTTPALQAHVARFATPEKIALLPNGVELDRFCPGERQESAAKKTLLFVGRLTAQKKLPLLIEALAPLRDRVRLICVGAGEEETAWRRLAAEHGVEVDWRGVVPNEQLPEIYRRADLFVLPSRVEGHPKALLEAMASGLPCLGAAAPGIRDVLTHDVDGWLAEPDRDAWRKAVERLLDDPATARRLGDEARRTALSRYDLKAVLDREIELLCSVVRGRTGRPRVRFLFNKPRAAMLAAAREGRCPDELLYGLRSLQKRGWDASAGDEGFAAFFGGGLLKALDNRLSCDGRRTGFHLRQAWRLRDELRRADVVFATADSSALPVLWLKRLGLLTTPVVCASIGLAETFAADRGPVYRWYKRLLPLASAILVYSPAEAAELGAAFALPREKVRFVPFGVECEFFAGTAAPVGRPLAFGLDQRRDWPTLFAALRQAEIEMDVLTNPDLLRGLTPPPQARLAAPEPIDRLRDRLRRAPFVVLPVKENLYSGGTISLLQAMAAGRAVIVSRTRAIADGYGLADGENCLLVPPGDVAALAAAIARLAHDPSLAARLGAAARDHVCRHYSVERLAAAVDAALREAMP